MPSISKDELLRLAKTGASARVRELQAELESIFSLFPDLRTGAKGRSAKAKSASKPATASRAWSAADRRAVSERMKKYWAARRAKSSKSTK